MSLERGGPSVVVAPGLGSTPPSPGSVALKRTLPPSLYSVSIPGTWWGAG